MQTSRDKSLKIPKEIKINLSNINNAGDEIAIQKGLFTANNIKFNQKQVEELISDRYQKWGGNEIRKIPANANDLIVVTTVKRLSAYIITITEKSPAKYRGVFVNRMQNYCLDSLEFLLQANFTKMDSEENKILRETYQKDAIIKLKMLGYISMVATNSNCILMKQYKQISIQIGEAINLISAWKKSDDKRYKSNKGF